ncbi:MAG: sigma-70 family RNA polymerase sigma factor [Saprospiraceae bacterium]|nr:sigma-70 family RNA polymerase sigma factor [Saprospiraceae bacterium]
MSFFIKNSEISDTDIIQLIRDRDEKGIDLMFQRFYKICVTKAYQVLADSHTAEDIVQELFSDLWTKGADLEVNQSLSSYLQKSVFNRSLNFIKAKKLNFEELDAGQNELGEESYEIDTESKEALLKEMEVIIDGLPEKCRIVFTMSKFEKKSYAQIANDLGISIKTVENQISKAFKILKNNLKK